MHIVLLSGGSGARLWPLSNNARSKQFLKVLRDERGNSQSMVQRTFEKINNLGYALDITIATCATQVASIEAQIKGGYDIVVEPERRDTAPAIMLSAAFLADVQGVALDETVIVLPIDTFADQAYYDKLLSIDEAVQNDLAEIVLLGAKPTYPSEKFGYIVPGKQKENTHEVLKFIEKPDVANAKELTHQGAFWNCGVFGFKLGYLLNIVKGYQPQFTFEGLCSDYLLLPKNSFDYEVVEKARSVAVVSYSGEWKDLGTWNTLTEEMKDFQAGRVLSADCISTHVVNELGLPMIVSGLRDAVVVATPDGILVSSKESSAHIKPLVSQIAEARPMYETRQWGEYKVLGQSVFKGGANSLEKELFITAGKQLSYQKHSYRSEVWVVVDGTGEVVIDGHITNIHSGSVVTISAGQKHAVRAFEDLSIIEVQMGTELVEEDIERFGFFSDWC